MDALSRSAHAMKGYIKLRRKAFKLLDNHLSPELTYHGIHHTMDVLDTVNFYIRLLKISRKDAQLLRIAALYHDIGFTDTYREHEKRGVEILKESMQEFGCDMSLHKPISDLIMATKIPQSPPNLLGKILCDADLFYLGGNRYYEISETLFRELKNFNMIETREQWTAIQISFLKSHSYHTEYARKHLQNAKNERIAELSSLPERST